MGLTAKSTGIHAVDNGLKIVKTQDTDKVFALAGNPNVGKSTVFNALTGMNQHTGNWPGKTVSNAQGVHHYQGANYILVDLPGTYSLLAHSAEEEIARDFICFGGADGVIVVCDATCLERNLNLVLQTLEITRNVVVCVNLMDEAKKKHIQVNLQELERALGVPVVGVSARSNTGLKELMEKVSALDQPKGIAISYPKPVEDAISCVQTALEKHIQKSCNTRWLAMKLLDYNQSLMESANQAFHTDLLADPDIQQALETAGELLRTGGIPEASLEDVLVAHIVKTAEQIYARCVTCQVEQTGKWDRKLDHLLTSRSTGIPIMLALLCVIFWITITGANIPSKLLADGLFWVQDRLTDLFMYWHAPAWLHGMLVLGVYRVLAWVVSVMLPPMAIFFPLFTLLEDFGYLPRVAFNLDHYFKKAHACGKQALTMCMGFGCNAAGVVGCRIIDSPRERLIAILTNNFVPCNGRFPTLIAIITMFFVGMIPGPFQSVASSLILLSVILLGVILTFAVSRLLSGTILKGVPSSFTLELPPYRKPQIGKVVVRSIFDRTLCVLGRAIVVAAPAGLMIWIMANLRIGDMSILSHCAGFLDPFGRALGMDGVILLAFILGFPANEIVVPIILMAYLATGTIVDYSSLAQLKTILVDNGWTWVTAISTMLFCLMHWPCSTACLTIKKETQSWKWTAVSILLPTTIGIIVCFLFTTCMRLLHLG